MQTVFKRLVFKRMSYLALAVLLLGLDACFEEANTSGASGELASKTPAPILDVYKSPTCGCCGKWIDHIQASGFDAAVHHPADLNAVKSERGIAPVYQSCHTAVSPEGYVFEGHVPARFIKQFLQNPPDGAIGLSVPAMPLGSPGMEVNDQFTPYRVLLLKKDGQAEVYAEVDSAAQQYAEDEPS